MVTPVYSLAKPVQSAGGTMGTFNSASREPFHLNGAAEPEILIHRLGPWTLEKYPTCVFQVSSLRHIESPP